MVDCLHGQFFLKWSIYEFQSQRIIKAQTRRNLQRNKVVVVEIKISTIWAFQQAISNEKIILGFERWEDPTMATSFRHQPN